MSLQLPEGSIRNSLRRRHEALRRKLALRLGLRAAAGCALAISIAVVLGSLAAFGVSWAWARLALVAIVCVAALAWAVRRFLARAPGFDTYLESVELEFPDVRSWLRNAIDFAQASAGATATGTSRELADAVTHETAKKLDGLPLESLAPGLAPRRPLLAMAAGLALVVVAVLLVPRSVERSWATLWNPQSAAPPVGLAIEPGSVRVTPGASLTVFARVTGTDQRPRLMRDGQKPVEAVAEGRTAGTRLWRFDLAQLTREQEYQVRVVSTASPKYRISLAGEPVPVSFEVEYRAPAYARLPVQRGSALRGDLTALRGTRARVAVTFDRDLTALESKLPGGAAVEWKPLTARRWQGDVVLDREGEYELRAIASAGEAKFRYRMQPLADAPPVIAVRTPDGDVDLPAGQQLPVEVIGQDDLGLTELELEYRKSPSAMWSKLPLARFAERPREAEVRARWDASSLAMLPGETATFRFVLFDDNAIGGRNRAESPVFELRFPSLGDLYEQIDKSQGGVQRTLEKVADHAKELQKSLDKLTRQQPRAQQSTPAFERSEEMKSSLERQQQLAKQLDQAAQDLRESVEKAGERQAFSEELERKLREMAQLMEQIQSNEFREALKRMREAMENLDRRAMENELPEWRQENREMLQNIERTLQLLKKLREEEKLDSLAKRAEELKARQDQLNKEHEAAEQRDANGKPNDSKSAEQRAQEAQDRAGEQERASQDSEKLAQDVKEMAKQLDAQQDQQQLEQTAEDVQQQAAAPQREAASSAKKMQSGQAKKMGQKASDGLQRAAQQLQKMANDRQNQGNSADLAALRRSAQDLVSLQRESEGNLQPGRPNDERANRQTDLSEGVARVADSLGVLAQNTPFLSPKLRESLGKAMNQLSQSGKDLASGNRARGEQMGRDGGTALNEAILELRQSEAAMCKNPGQGEGEAPGMSQRMAGLGQQQSQLNQRSKSLAQRLSEQMRLSAGDREQLQRLGQEQARLREQLEQIQRDDDARRQLLGRLDATRRDMQEVEEALRQGSTSGDLEEKQTRILSRLLDAQRSVNRRDFDPERESRAGAEILQRSAPEIPAELLRESDRLRSDLLKADADRYPAQYRAFIEAYLKSLNGQRR